MVGDDVWHQREKRWICFVLGAPSVAFQAEERAIAAVFIDIVASWMKDNARYRSGEAFLTFSQSLDRCLNLFSILFLFFLEQSRHEPTGGMENCLKLKVLCVKVLSVKVHYATSPWCAGGKQKKMWVPWTFKSKHRAPCGFLCCSGEPAWTQPGWLFRSYVL